MSESPQTPHPVPNAVPEVPREGTPAQHNAVPAQLGLAPDPADPSNLGSQAPPVQPPPQSLAPDEEDLDDEEYEDEEVNFDLGFGDDFIMKDPPYTVRPLNNGDTFKVGNMLGKVVGDPRLREAAASGDPTLIIGAALGALFDKVHRDLQLFCGDLVGIKRDYKEMRRTELAESQAEGRMPVNESQLRRQMEDEIIAQFETLPMGAAQDIVAKVMEREDFTDFLKSSMRLGKVAGRVFSRLQTNT